MPFNFFDHTGDIGVDIESPSLDGLFADAGAALVETLTDATGVRTQTLIPLDLSSPELDLLLVDWLSELLFRFETAGFLPAVLHPHVTRGEAWGLHAELRGEPGAAVRLPIKVLIKAVTYHALEVRQLPAGWRARVIFDI